MCYALLDNQVEGGIGIGLGSACCGFVWCVMVVVLYAKDRHSGGEDVGAPS